MPIPLCRLEVDTELHSLASLSTLSNTGQLSISIEVQTVSSIQTFVIKLFLTQQDVSLSF